MIIGDVCDVKGLSSALDGDVDAVVHMAAFGMMGWSNLSAWDDVTERVNVGGTRNVVDACIKKKVKALGKEYI